MIIYNMYLQAWNDYKNQLKWSCQAYYKLSTCCEKYEQNKKNVGIHEHYIEHYFYNFIYDILT